jgi:DNA-binding NarL/FixJ family response regulator
LRFFPDLVEALIALGRPAAAIIHLEFLEECAQATGRLSSLAAAARCRGLLAANRADLESSLAAIDRALDLYGRLEMPFERARTLLAHGVTLRRAKRRRHAREVLQHALAEFDRLGARLWSERTRAELARIAGRAPSAGELTPAERRVASLVAEGKTNREVAAALYLSERTVEGHLAHVFNKLGVRSRTELARAIASRPDSQAHAG